MKWRHWFGSLLVLALAARAGAGDALPVVDLLAAREPVRFQLGNLQPDWTTIQRPSGAVVLSAPDNVRNAVIRLVPEGRDAWDFSSYSYFRLELQNTGSSLLWVEGRLDNQDAKDWSNSSASQLFLHPGESGTLGFAFPRSGSLDDSPRIFAGMNAKPNGWRSHWKAFDPSRVLSLRLAVHSAAAPALEIVGAALAWPYGSTANAALEELPFLDEFGQVRQLEWDGKLSGIDELERRTAAGQQELRVLPRPRNRDRFGGWADGPQFEATGYFRLARHQGQWWFVDPDGRLFWSHGVNAVGFASATPATRDRRPLFAWLPAENDPLYRAIIQTNGNQPRANFMAGNLARRHGREWEPQARDLVHRRFAEWGLNTLGAWSDGNLLTESRTPFTLMLHVGWPQLAGKLPDPFAPEAPLRLETALTRAAAGHGTNAWCLGVFIDNEVHWSRDLIETVFAQPADAPSKVALVEFLKEHHRDIAMLNAVWNTDHADWESLLQLDELERTDANGKDLDSMMEHYAAAYYRLCRDTMRQIMPHHLYLGSRIHTCPAPVARAAARFVDVYSINHYWNRAGTGALPPGVDVPVLITEFHFGAPDRGVPGCGLMSVHDQVQRGRAYQNYVASGLRHPQVVGTHWFTWADQSSAGRPGENYQIGFVDVTDTPYHEFTTACRQLGQRMYEVRSNPAEDLLAVLESLSESGPAGAMRSEGRPPARAAQAGKL